MRIIILFFILLSVQFCFAVNGMQTKGEKQLVEYKVQPKDTWTNLAKKYHTTVKELQAENKGITDLKIGQVIKVHAPIAAKENIVEQQVKQQQVTKPNTSPTDKKKPLYYIVKPRETLYHISKIHNITVEELKKWNGLSSNNVSIDQRLIVGYSKDQIEKVTTLKEVPAKETYTEEVKNPKPVEVTEVKPSTVKKEKEAITDSVIDVTKETPVVNGANKITETGVVSWFGDGDLNQNKFYALHRTAPIGTIIKVTNRMNNNSVFVKVVGALPTTGDNENILLKITQAAAQRIGALDQKFQAELSYVVPQ